MTTDWTLRECARAKIRVIVKRILNKCGIRCTDPVWRIGAEGRSFVAWKRRRNQLDDACCSGGVGAES